jgi:hypothetical protein
MTILAKTLRAPVALGIVLTLIAVLPLQTRRRVYVTTLADHEIWASTVTEPVHVRTN